VSHDCETIDPQAINKVDCILRKSDSGTDAGRFVA
jgi:hypothetical protein